MSSNKKATRIQSIQRATTIINYVASQPSGSEIKEIAYTLNINLSTCYHIVNTLVDEEYLFKKENDQYVLGNKINALNEHSSLHQKKLTV